MSVPGPGRFAPVVGEYADRNERDRRVVIGPEATEGPAAHRRRGREPAATGPGPAEGRANRAAPQRDANRVNAIANPVRWRRTDRSEPTAERPVQLAEDDVAVGSVV